MKVFLIGDSGVGKTHLSYLLSKRGWQHVSKIQPIRQLVYEHLGIKSSTLIVDKKLEHRWIAELFGTINELLIKLINDLEKEDPYCLTRIAHAKITNGSDSIIETIRNPNDFTYFVSIGVIPIRLIGETKRKIQPLDRLLNDKMVDTFEYRKVEGVENEFLRFLNGLNHPTLHQMVDYNELDDYNFIRDFVDNHIHNHTNNIFASIMSANI